MSMRDEFESRFAGVYGMGKDELNQYVNADTAAAWDGWQAREQGAEPVANGEPLPCPFCGDKPEWVKEDDPSWPQVECKNLECPISHSDWISLDAWNRRAYTRPQSAGTITRDDLIQCLLATQGQSEGVAADAILSMIPVTGRQVAITPAMIEAGAKRLVRWEDDCVWPDSWRSIDIAAAKQDAERVIRSALAVAGGSHEQ